MNGAAACGRRKTQRGVRFIWRGVGVATVVADAETREKRNECPVQADVTRTWRRRIACPDPVGAAQGGGPALVACVCLRHDKVHLNQRGKKTEY